MGEIFPDRAAAAFQANFEAGREVGAAMSVWRDGLEVMACVGGFRDRAKQEAWGAETLVPVWSATKGPAAACVLRCVDEAGLTPETAVVEIWPEFAKAGKAGVTIGQVLSHTAGLGALRCEGLSVFDHPAVAAALAEQEPFGEAIGRVAYGPRTVGFLMDEIVRRLTGGTLGSYWRKCFGDPIQLNFWMGLPEAEDGRVATMLAPRSAGDAEDRFIRAFADPTSLTRRAFSEPGGLVPVSAINWPEARRASIPSMGGIGSASALAKFYGELACGRGVSGRVLEWMSGRRSSGMDLILCAETAFSAGFMMDPVDGVGTKSRPLMGPSERAFGHPGAGGSLAFADPENRLGFAYVMNQMEPGVLPGGRARGLVDALYGL